MTLLNFRQNPRYTILAGITILSTLFLLSSHSANLGSWAPALPALSGSNGAAYKPGQPIDRSTLKGRLARAHERWDKMLAQRKAFLDQHETDYIALGTFPLKKSFNFWDLVPPIFQCPWEVERLGTMGDGGKWICGAASRLATKKDCVIYSFGVNTESSFEEELLSMTTHCEVWGYDFSVNGWGEQITPRNTHRVHFNKVGLGPKDKHDGKNQFYTLDTIMKQNGHKHIDILKVDIEGAEFDALNAWIAPYVQRGEPLPIGQFSIEIHFWNKSFKFVRAWWDFLEEAGLRPFWMEPNLPYLNWNRNNAPDLSEYTFLNVKGKNVFITD